MNVGRVDAWWGVPEAFVARSRLAGLGFVRLGGQVPEQVVVPLGGDEWPDLTLVNGSSILVVKSVGLVKQKQGKDAINILSGRTEGGWGGRISTG